GGVADQSGDLGELAVVGDRLGEDVDGAGDDGEDVVEVVRDAAGELADGFHLLCLADRALVGLRLAETLEKEFRALALASFLRERDMRLAQLRLGRDRQDPRDQRPQQYRGDDRGDRGQRLDQAFEAVDRHPQRIDREYMREAAGEDEGGERPGHPAKLDVAPLGDEDRERKRDREIRSGNDGV
ncbi:hypothetical protein chiPu_0031662, partial [Chiloscyllium punctatum]|nr:hypothetical protein [Chiloscyllium punctatum]